MAGIGLAETTRTLVVRASSLTLHGLSSPVETLHHRLDDAGTLLLVVRSAAAAVAGLTPGGPPLHVGLTAVDVCPVPVAHRIRGTVRMQGRLEALGAADAAPVLAPYAAERPWPGAADAGTDGYALLRLRPSDLRTALGCGQDGAGRSSWPVEPRVYAAASADPLAHVEADWLSHLTGQHREEMSHLGHAAAPEAAREGRRVRVSGLDRTGLRFRVESSTTSPTSAAEACCREATLPFTHPVRCPCEANVAFNALVQAVGVPAGSEHPECGS